ncbi:MAG: DUF2236 domain-containing protein [Betaproteobacteria bacterium]|nr:DUF2236 domain-containing protein [Betaproteobacteria bacterium]
MLREALRRRVRIVAGGDGRAPLQYLQPPGDPGLFGPDSQTWRVHADFPAMMVGGIGALLLQALHPLALAGVWDHSSFRQDLRGRLARTARFIAETSYGSTAMAGQALARVRAIHEQVRGQHPDGREYRADDPRLLYWVHLSETWSFLQAHRVFVDPGMEPVRRDRYFEEMARIPLALGCAEGKLPHARIARSEREAREDLLAYRGELEFSERSRFVLDLLRDMPAADAPPGMQQLFVQAALHELPDWAYPMMQLPAPSPLRREALRAGIRVLAQPLRWALKDGVAAHARRRMGRG